MAETLDITADGKTRPMTVLEALEMGRNRQDSGDLSGAAEIYQQIHNADPNQVDALHLLGVISHRLGDYALAADLITAALAIAPDFAEAHGNLGVVFFDQGRFEEATACYEQAMTLKADYADPHNNMGALNQRLGKLEKAVANYRKAIAINPDYAEAHNNLATMLLLSGNFVEGWIEFSWRWKIPQFSKALKNLPNPVWDGSPLAGKRILVWEEQGIGESILFAGLIPELLQQGAEACVECDPRMVPLFARSFPQITCMAAANSTQSPIKNGDFYCHAPLADLGRWLRPDAGSFAPAKAYLTADQDRSASLRSRYLEKAGNLLVGLAWISNSPHYAERKSMTLNDLEAVLGIPGVSFVDLQYGDTGEERAAFTARTGIDIIHDDSVDQMADLDAFAAQVAALDMVVTISNTTAHMAGGLGVETLLMLDTQPIWYWQLERPDSQWYCSLRLYRQSRPGDWPDVIGGVAEGVKEYLADRR